MVPVANSAFQPFSCFATAHVLWVMNAATARTVAKMNAGVPSLRAMSSPSRVKCHGPLLERKAVEGCDANHTLVDRRKQLLLSGAGFERPPLLKDSLVEGISVRGSTIERAPSRRVPVYVVRAFRTVGLAI